MPYLHNCIFRLWLQIWRSRGLLECLVPEFSAAMRSMVARRPHIATLRSGHQSLAFVAHGRSFVDCMRTVRKVNCGEFEERRSHAPSGPHRFDRKESLKNGIETGATLDTTNFGFLKLHHCWALEDRVAGADVPSPTRLRPTPAVLCIGFDPFCRNFLFVVFVLPLRPFS